MQNTALSSSASRDRLVRGRGRPRAFHREEALLEAMRLFWRKGYAATSISELLEVMGIGSPSLYAAFGSKEALYAEAIRSYGDRYEGLVWAGFAAAPTARKAIEALLMDSAGALTASRDCNDPKGCMVTLSAVGSEGYDGLGDLVRSARAEGRKRVIARLERAVSDGELDPSVDVATIACFVMTVQGGMSLQARDGAGCEELRAVADLAMMSWDRLAS